MSTVKMHADEVDTSEALVRNLLTTQFPQWAHLPIQPAIVSGTDNAIFRLGENMLARLPRIEWAVEQVEKEQRWLSKIAGFLPVAIPSPIAKGVPGCGYPWNWSIYDWIEGENAPHSLVDSAEIAAQIADFITHLHRIQADGGPLPGSHNFRRGVPLIQRDEWTIDAIGKLDGLIDVQRVTAAWKNAMNTPAWQAQPVWIHGDLQPGNMLFRKGQLAAVIDFGGLAVGDPAVDLMIAWSTFSPDTRSAFRKAVDVDDDTWARGRGWALSVALLNLPYYMNTNKPLAEQARRSIDAIMAEFNGKLV